jgi:hypothetical protein
MKYIISAILAILAAVTIYFFFRADKLESEYSHILTGKFNGIMELTSKNTSLNSFSKETLKSVFTGLSTKDKSIALIAASDLSGSLVVGIKNELFIPSNDVYDDITNDFLGGRINPPKGTDHVTRYYQGKKFYIFQHSLQAGNLLIAYPYIIPGKMMIQSAIELFTIILLIIAGTGLLYVKNKNTNRGSEEIPESKTNKIENNKTYSETDITELFHELYGTLSLNAITLYLLDGKKELSKQYEMKGKTFVKINGGKMPEKDKQKEIMNELTRGSTIVKNRSRTLIIPLNENRTLAGALYITGTNPISGRDEKNIRKTAKQIIEIIGSIRKSK